MTRRWRYKLAPDPLHRKPKGVLPFWSRMRRLFWAWWPWAAACVWNLVHDKWGWAIGMGLMAFACYLITPSESEPRYGLDHEFAIDDDEFLATVAGATGVPFLPGNKLTILNNGDAFYPAMLEAINAAEVSITIEAYIYWAGDIGREFAEALAAFTLHCASRPPKETIAWTLHFQEPFVNLFLGGDTDDSIVTGRVFAEDVKEMESNRIYADVARPGRDLQRSMVSFDEGGAFEAVEAFYAKSEQLPARCFNLGDERYAIAFAHPDCDMPWFESLTAGAIANIGDTETIVPMERRMFRWKCGCNERKILEVLAPLMKQDPEGLFGGADSVQVNCPRCAARYTVARAVLEAFVAKREE